MPAFLDQHTISAYFEVVVINLLLSGDNVIVIGMAAAGLVSELRGKAIAVGIAAAAVIRIIFAVIAARLLVITGITLAGGLMLLWICWTMGCELLSAEAEEAHAGDAVSHIKPKLFRQAIGQIIFADVSMSLDNVLAVAGAAKENTNALIFGLLLSVLLMGVASNFVAKLLNRFRWIGWIGLAIIVYVALDMIWSGGEQLLALYGHTA
ncbi:YjbE family putative metal transport protein [Rhizobium laguerreae]|uniref:YjbE family putative metal transport protein n=1 Tax=Rhizobium TaxID=379 RepID=UPI0003A10B09|nr:MULTISPECIES: YjbE family putative metal transport protein [Rhizobium]MBW8788482.1 YjbE family putative metal transport protein [Rhizobium leguminosarum]MBY5367693.1 YjbE family putative metal transport protein [Rhizobium leguminosarum]MBY5451004.1 YjbE family putative metal transport protein [Rhizobium leguminosarum]NNG69081.1 YjbE family putative metal transport protein [Rhizobium laguerreae]